MKKLLLFFLLTSLSSCDLLYEISELGKTNDKDLKHWVKTYHFYDDKNLNSHWLTIYVSYKAKKDLDLDISNCCFYEYEKFNNYNLFLKREIAFKQSLTQCISSKSLDAHIESIQFLK